MKRVIAVYCIIALILAASSVSLYHLIHATDRMEVSLGEITQALETEDYQLAVELTGQFQEEWENNEKIMTRYIHHDELDSITGIVARLPALLQYDAISEYAAEVRRLQHLIVHIRDAELPTLANIF